MKQKFVLFVLLITLVQVNSFAQASRVDIPSSYPLLAEDEITSITASENIDLILIQTETSDDNEGAKASNNVMGKLKVSFKDGNLNIATAKNVSKEERLVVYVWVHELESLTLNGNSFATSVGILKGKNLHVSAESRAMFSLKSKGKVWFDTPAKYQVTNEKGYFFVNAL